MPFPEPGREQLLSPNVCGLTLAFGERTDLIVFERLLSTDSILARLPI